ncbi:ABC transporter permease subunit [Candidatus Bathyarchaeota archaeon]|nr:ABC transporter permease subunit [Candidatus Bathyarchaeota archaeon]
MNEIVDGIIKAFELVFSLDPTLYNIVFRSLYVSGIATAMATLWSLPIAIVLGLKNVPGKRLIRASFNAFLGIPTVVLGLILFLLLSRSGPLGMFGLLFTPLAISIGQAILITPIIVSFITSAIESIDLELRDLARTLGSTEIQASTAILQEASGGVTLALIAAFNRAFSELGVAMILGGNIHGLTRILTTAISLETARGEIAFSIALGVILVSIVYTLSIILNYLRRS